MIRRPPRSTRTDTLFPYTTLFRSILFGLEVDDHAVRIELARADAREDIVRHRLELDQHFGLALRHPLAGAQVEGHALPAPIVDERLQSDEGFGVRRIAEFVGIAGDRLSPHCAAGILTLDAMRLDVLCADRKSTRLNSSH